MEKFTRQDVYTWNNMWAIYVSTSFAKNVIRHTKCRVAKHSLVSQLQRCNPETRLVERDVAK